MQKRQGTIMQMFLTADRTVQMFRSSGTQEVALPGGLYPLTFHEPGHTIPIKKMVSLDENDFSQSEHVKCGLWNVRMVPRSPCRSGKSSGKVRSFW